MIVRILKGILIACGVLFLLFFGLSFTTAPFYSLYYLATAHGDLHRPPGYIVVMGASGMPGEAGLIRTWYAAEIARQYPGSKVIISLPGDTADSTSSVRMMKREMIVRGIAAERVLMENQGINTRDEALCVYRMLKDPGRQRICVVSSPVHIYRCVRTFKKAGFQLVDGIPAFDRALESSVEYRDKNLGGRSFIPSLGGGSISLRYTFWGQMKYELIVLREWAAIGYYKLKGWL